jgi:acyl-CoA synthetase (AMP-forming)/AMP-acid ligase II
MYGQTEATARITITHPQDLFTDVSTAGRAVAGGELEIRSPDENGTGEVWYRGPNVMLGYAEHADDLARPDDMGSVLETGDLGYLVDGMLFLTGRSKRIVKIFGKRVSLDDVDQWVQARTDGVAVQGNDAVVLFVVGEADAGLRTDLAEFLHVHPTGVRVVELDDIPLMSSGKIDYQELNRRALA